MIKREMIPYLSLKKIGFKKELLQQMVDMVVDKLKIDVNVML